MLDAETRDLLGRGCALIVGLVEPDGSPYATRAWGVEVEAEEPLRLRLLMDRHDRRGLDALVEGAAVAITAADVRTLSSVQFKGRSEGPAPGRLGDEARARRYVDDFFTDIAETDGTPRATLDRLVPEGLVPVVVGIEARFDQTPGPSAGRAVR